MTGFHRWLLELQKIYRSNVASAIDNRLAGWRGRADQTVLMFALLEEMKALRYAIDRLNARGNDWSRPL
jgi:hypothetical protein